MISTDLMVSLYFVDMFNSEVLKSDIFLNVGISLGGLVYLL